MDRLGNLKHCFPQELEENLGFAEKTIFQAPNNCFLGNALVKLRQARVCKKKSGSNNFFRHCSCETQASPALPKKIRVSKNASSAHALVKTQTSPALQKKIRLYFFWHCSCETQASPALQKKSGSKQLFFRHCSCETQASSALPKKGSKVLFFSALLV